jgi:hypothetical protein
VEDTGKLDGSERGVQKIKEPSMIVTLVRSKAVPQVAVKRNEKSWPKSYKCNFLEPGIVSYEDVGQGVALLKKESMDNWIQTFKGKPVIIDHQDVSPENFKKAAVGYITNVYYNDKTGWYDAEFIITDDEGHQVIENGYSVSCSFDVLNTSAGGEWHANKFDEEIIEGDGQHLALVTSPRYEDCRIVVNSKKAKVENKEDAVIKKNDQDLTLMSTMQLDKYMGALSDVGIQAIMDGEHDESIKKIAKLHQTDRATKKEEELLASSGGNKEKKDSKMIVSLNRKKEDAKMWKFWKRKEDKVENEKIDATKIFVDVDGEKVPLATIMNSIQKTDEFEMLSEQDEVTVDGRKYNVKELVDSYKKSKSNDAEEPEKKEPEEKKDDDKKCSCGKKEHDADCPAFVKKEDDDKKNDAEDPEKKEPDDKEVKNSKEKGKEFFVDLQNARQAPKENDAGPVRGGARTREDKAAQGKKFFGSRKK